MRLPPLITEKKKFTVVEFLEYTKQHRSPFSVSYVNNPNRNDFIIGRKRFNNNDKNFTNNIMLSILKDKDIKNILFFIGVDIQVLSCELIRFELNIEI